MSRVNSALYVIESSYESVEVIMTYQRRFLVHLRSNDSKFVILSENIILEP